MSESPGRSLVIRRPRRSPLAEQGLTRRACDQCHARKIKCNGCSPCLRCCKGQTQCTFLNPVLPKGPAPKNPTKRSTRRKRQTSAPTQTPSLSDLLGLDSESLSWLVPSRNPTRAPSPLSHGCVALTDSSNATDELDRLFSNQSLRQTPRPPAQGLPDFSFLEESSYSLPSQTWSFPFASTEDPSPLVTLTLHSLIKPQLEVFFIRVAPMIPVFDREDVFPRIHQGEHLHNRAFTAMILAMCALSLIHPLESHELPERPARMRQAKSIMDEACRLQARWDFGCMPCLEQVLTSYLLFGTLFELGQNDGARLRLREALAVGEALRLDDARSYTMLGPAEGCRRLRMFWILAITERAYALQRSGSILFKGPLTPTGLVLREEVSPLRYLARLFAFLDQDIIGCWNGHCDKTACSVLTRDRVVYMLVRLSGPMSQVFGDSGAENLTEVQLADLLVTWQWLRNRLWRLALLHGLTREDEETVLSTDFPVDVAIATVAICRKLSMSSMEAHGTGFVEKLFDIASTVTELLQTLDPLSGRLLQLSQTNQWSTHLQALHGFVSRHRSGDVFAATLGHAVANLPWDRLQVQ